MYQVNCTFPLTFSVTLNLIEIISFTATGIVDKEGSDKSGQQILCSIIYIEE